MVNDVYDASKPLWYKSLWRISFRNNNCYIVSSNTDLDMNYDRDESALDPLTKTLLYSNNSCTQESSDDSNMFLYAKYHLFELYTQQIAILMLNLSQPFQSKLYSSAEYRKIKKTELKILYLLKISFNQILLQKTNIILKLLLCKIREFKYHLK